ncbi:Aquaporin-1 [Friedmanniomyces endolithicus]|uniref:Aquaporin-1 n=1 Tax=Friedmanniomyces endolithicus TaxID=329885 RepID=A0AAN6R2N1_9PEZI|nr:Aquaporin-1 [Friedmanniomyces endolithicus]KAK0809283.1 Aquaporin-1 [Friedmanniomyces endolithicus]KAK0850038.1 Aquaporin-1 [Friedmanniomyces endolithicus]KAK1015675.1 Aquaporin-1 [Friedmanniomyces endolithicus]
MNIAPPSERWINIPGFGAKKTKSTDLAMGTNPVTKRRELRVPCFGFLPNKVRNHFIAMVGELVGTFLFLFFAFAATQVANAAAAAANANGNGAQTSNGGISQSPNASTLLYISLAFGFSLAVNAWVFFRITGGLFNPAVTLALALIGAVPWIRAGLVFIAQILGSIAASAVVLGLFPGSLNVATNLGGGTTIVQGLFIEMFLTAMLVFTILMLAAEKHKGTFLAPIGIGLALFVAEMAGVYYTGGSLNPARSFGVNVILGSFPGYHWIYWLGPFLGALLAVGFYRFVKMLEYETANPGQDFNEKEAEVFEFDEDNAATGADVSRPTVGVGSPQLGADENALRSIGSHDSAASPLGPSGSPVALGQVPTTLTGPNGNGAGRVAPLAPTVSPTGPSALSLDKTRARAPDASYRDGPAAEAGAQMPRIGGDYRVSGASTLGGLR